ncbi:MAG: hypothetical protein KGJ59_06750 [Bacteroidota bacterium]|nr:hypothetical protein [Bacteroidota bacterium]
MAQRPQFVIGMDGGGTKTAAIIANLHGDILAEHTAGPSNFQIIGVEETARVLFSLIKSCCDSAGCNFSDISAMTIGLTGAGRPVDQKRMKDGLLKYAAKKDVLFRGVRIESDARIALEGAFKGSAGIILIAGTGSIAFGKDAKGNVHRTGGWGRIIGDEGSGYFIGRAGMSAVTHHLDGRSPATKLTSLVSKKFGLKNQTDIVAAVYKNNFDLASVAPLVLNAAEKDDRVCRAIVNAAVMELETHVRSLIPKLHARSRHGVKEKSLLTFIGGLIANDTLLAQLLRKRLPEVLPDVRIIKPMAPPVYGAVIMSLGNFSLRRHRDYTGVSSA